MILTNQLGAAPLERPAPGTEGVTSMQDQPTCRDCGTSVSTKSKTRRCRRCAMAATGRSNRVHAPTPCPACRKPVVRSDSRWCSWECYVADRDQPTGEAHHSWKGDEVGVWGLRRRAQKMFPPGPCRVCGETGVRHHIDGDPSNNVAENIEYLCRAHHAALHHERGDLVLPPNAR